jgi:hypothetical protein
MKLSIRRADQQYQRNISKASLFGANKVKDPPGKASTSPADNSLRREVKSGFCTTKSTIVSDSLTSAVTGLGRRLWMGLEFTSWRSELGMRQGGEELRTGAESFGPVVELGPKLKLAEILLSSALLPVMWSEEEVVTRVMQVNGASMAV